MAAAVVHITLYRGQVIDRIHINKSTNDRSIDRSTVQSFPLSNISVHCPVFSVDRQSIHCMCNLMQQRAEDDDNYYYDGDRGDR